MSNIDEMPSKAQKKQMWANVAGRINSIKRRRRLTYHIILILSSGLLSGAISGLLAMSLKNRKTS